MHLRLWQGVLTRCRPAPGLERHLVDTWGSFCGLGPGKALGSGTAKAKGSEFGVFGPNKPKGAQKKLGGENSFPGTNTFPGGQPACFPEDAAQCSEVTRSTHPLPTLGVVLATDA